MALASGGEAALTQLLGLYKHDMRTALGLTGAVNARDVGRGVLLEGWTPVSSILTEFCDLVLGRLRSANHSQRKC